MSVGRLHSRRTTLRCKAGYVPFDVGDNVEAVVHEDEGAFYLRLPKTHFEEDDPRAYETIVVVLDAHEPEYLLGIPGPDGTIMDYVETPEGVWLRVDDPSGPGGGNPVVAVMGPRRAVHEFVRDNWGTDAMEVLTEADPSAAGLAELG